MVERPRAPAERRRLLLRGLGIVAGSYVLLRILLYAFGGSEHLFEFSAEAPHKLTAQALMTGTLRLYPGVWGAQHDQQVYNGGTFTNFGFGVPLLEIPFHALARLLGRGRFLSDRFIFFLYLSALVPFFWTSLHRSLSGPSRTTRPWLLSWSLALVLIGQSLFVLLSYRFIEYEETIAYLVVFELAALACYLRFADSGRLGWVCAMAAAAGVATVVRPTGAVYLVLWGALAVWNRRTGRVAAAYLAGAGPFVGFWLWSNYLKAGGPLALGYQNTNVYFAFQYATERFGSQCTETTAGFMDTARELFEALFVRIEYTAPPALAACRFVYETRAPGEHSPFFPPAVLVLFFASVAVYATTRPRRLDLIFAHAGIVALFATFVRAGIAFAYRYVGDFWPMFALIAVQLAQHVRLGARPAARHATAVGAVLYSGVLIFQDVRPYLDTIATVDAAKIEAVVADWLKARADTQPPLPSRFTCGDVLASWPVENGLGLGPHCEVASLTNLYLGVPPRKSPGYTLRFRTDAPVSPELRVLVNGRLYRAYLENGVYSTPVSIDYQRLYSPVVVVTVEWTRGPLPGVRLMGIELA